MFYAIIIMLDLTPAENRKCVNVLFAGMVLAVGPGPNLLRVSVAQGTQ